MSVRITIYSTAQCPYCIAAKKLLESRSIEFNSVDLTDQFDKINELKQQYGHSTVPIVVLDDKLVGGYTELAALDKSGELQRILTS